jgi:hypothetical protein
MTEKWEPIQELPPPGVRKGKYWVIVAGSERHSGKNWARQSAGLAKTDNDGFYLEDVCRIALDDCMDLHSAEVTHFMTINLPNFP